MNLMSQLHNKKENALDMALARHDAFITRYLGWLADRPGHETDGRVITILARSPESPVAAAVLARSDELHRSGATIQAIFADLGEDGALAAFCEAIAPPAKDRNPGDSIRWARNACLRHAHEQLILGTTMCWSGDSMRREPGKRDCLDLFEAEAPQVVRLGALAFDAIWAISDPAPASRLSAAAIAKPSAAYGAGDEERWSAFSFLRKSDRANPLAH